MIYYAMIGPCGDYSTLFNISCLWARMRKLAHYQGVVHLHILCVGGLALSK
jgi:hypothetical protein